MIRIDIYDKTFNYVVGNEVNTNNKELKMILKEYRIKFTNSQIYNEIEPVYLGLDDEQKRIIYDLKDLGSILIYGKKGSGKTNLVKLYFSTISNILVVLKINSLKEKH